MKPLLLEEIKQAVRGELKTSVEKGLVTSVTTDSRNVPPNSLFVALRGERFDGHDFIADAIAAGARAVLMDRNIPIPEDWAARGVCVMKVGDAVAALGDLARFYRRSLGHRVTVIAVTGSAGKTTTREMIYHALSKYKKGHRSPNNYNNQIGVPLTLLGIEPEHEFAVVEMGTNAPGEIATLSRIAEPDIAVITHVGASHLEKLGSVDGVSVEKVSISAGLKERGVLVCGASHPGTLDRVRALGRHVITFGLEEDMDVRGFHVIQEPGKVRFEISDHTEIVIPVGGIHNVENALAALAVVRRMGLTSREFAAAMTDFKGAKHRMEYLSVNGITIIDDCYNANPSSMRMALQELCSHKKAMRRVLVVGDMYELGEAAEQAHMELGRKVAASNVDILFAVGPHAAITAITAIESGMPRGQVQRSITSKRLARLIKSMIFEGDVILVKGSRAMQMEKVVESLSRFRGRRSFRTGMPRVIRMGETQSIGEPAARRPNPSYDALKP